MLAMALWKTSLLGPLVNETAVGEMVEFMDDAKTKGANIVTGGGKHELGHCFFEPTLITGITQEMRIAREEIFGPYRSHPDV